MPGGATLSASLPLMRWWRRSRRSMTVLSEAVLPSTEEERNRILRRIDWRFLLPEPAVDTTVCAGADDLLVDAVSVISKNVIDIAQAQPGSASLAVLVDPSRDSLRAAWQALRPGAVCYAESRSLAPFRGR